MIRVAISRKPWTKSVASSSYVHVAANSSLIAPKSTLGYWDFKILRVKLDVVTPSFKAKLNAHSMCVQESSLHIYHIKNKYIITNVIIYNIYYPNNVFNNRLSRTLSK
jgi:hypothetical protein